MQFIDTHIHLQDYKSKNAPQIPDAAVVKFVCVSAWEADWESVGKLAQAFPQAVVPAFGLHPWYLAEALPGWEERLRARLQAFPRALIGECGLDRLKNPAAEPQQQAFAAHIRLAAELKRPLLVHAVKAQDWLENFWPQLQGVRFVLHSFGGSAEFMRRALHFGAYISFAPPVCSRKNFAELASSVPADKLLLESDGPYQGQPAEILALLLQLAACRGEPAEQLAARIYQNSQEFINV